MLRTEMRNKNTYNLDKMSTGEILKNINDENMNVFSAIEKAFEAEKINYHPSVINRLALQVTADFEEKITDDRMYYILLDEVQFVDEFEDVLNSFLHIKNADTYVTGSNAKFLSKDIITEFAGRGDEIHMYPLSFAEFMSCYQGDKYQGLSEYMLYGGIPLVVLRDGPENKVSALDNLFSEIYVRDIQKRNKD